MGPSESVTGLPFESKAAVSPMMDSSCDPRVSSGKPVQMQEAGQRVWELAGL